jgi:hypothetical protein
MPACVRDSRVNADESANAYVCASQLASRLQIPGSPANRGAAKPNATRGRFVQNRHAALQISPWPVKPGSVAVTSRSIAALAAIAAQSDVPRGTADRSAITTSTVAKPSASGRTSSRAVARSGSSSSRRRARSKSSGVTIDPGVSRNAWTIAWYRE